MYRQNPQDFCFRGISVYKTGRDAIHKVLFLIQLQRVVTGVQAPRTNDVTCLGAGRPTEAAVVFNMGWDPLGTQSLSKGLVRGWRE